MEAETIQPRELARAEARLPRWMVVVASAGAVAALLGGHARAAGGFVLGGTLSIVNYYWLRQAVVALFDAARSRVPRRLILKFVIRYPLAFAVVYLFYRTGWLPFGAVMAGLFVPAAGVLIESGVQIGIGWRVARRDS